jgi:4-alpha-glucanotransferase
VSLHSLAEAAGLALTWKDVHGIWHVVSDDTLRAVLFALDLPAATDADIASSLAALQAPGTLPPLITAEMGGTLHLTLPPGPYEIGLEDGTTIGGHARDESGAAFEAPPVPGYHRLRIGGLETVLAVAPPSGWTVADATPGRPWGLAVQLYSLRRPGDGGLGDFGGLADFVRNAAQAGASAVAISPVHAQFSGTPDRFSPYSPSSRVFLNVLHAKLDLVGEEAARLEAMSLVDWPAASRLRMARLSELFNAAIGTPLWDEFLRFRTAEGAALEGHARFEALHGHITAAGGPWHWRNWPGDLSDARSIQVAAFASNNAQEVTRHAFYQFLADRSLGEAQAAARKAGMPVGLISDLAVGVDSGGSQCWARPDQTLLGVTIGAPPDLLNTQGQGWGLAAFSPRGLQRNGFGAFIDMLRAAMRHAGGLRIDHAMGLARLWVIPDGGPSAEGVYLHFPVDDMLRLIRLESHRHRAIVLGEDLGTLPDGFQGRISSAGILGMRVLWFERAQDQGFIAPSHWDHGAVSMTSTHDLSTVAGWWSGHDIGVRHQVGQLDDAGVAREQGERQRDRAMLWSAMQASGAAQSPQPAPDQPATAVGAAIRHVGAAACAMTVIPMEDALALPDQPNVPGTLHEHPNWQRRLPGYAATLLDDPATADRLRGLDTIRNPG